MTEDKVLVAVGAVAPEEAAAEEGEEEEVTCHQGRGLRQPQEVVLIRLEAVSLTHALSVSSHKSCLPST